MTHKLMLFTLFASLTLFASPERPIAHFGDSEGRVLAEISHPSQDGDLFYTANIVLSPEHSKLFLIADDAVGAEIQILAVSDKGEHQRFMTLVSQDFETVIDLQDLDADMNSLLFLSRRSFTAALGDGHTYENFEVERNVFRSKPEIDHVRSKSDWTVIGNFSTLTCITPATCGTLSVSDTGKIYAKTTVSTSGDPTQNISFKLTWGCHVSSSNFGGYLFSTSSCGCEGTAVWYFSYNNVYRAQSMCPGDTEWAKWDVD